MKKLFAILITLLISQVAFADYRYMPRSNNDGIVLTDKSCNITSVASYPGGMFAIRREYRVGYIIAAGDKHRVCWNKEKDTIFVTFPSTGSSLDYPASKFKSIPQRDAEVKFGKLN